MITDWITLNETDSMSNLTREKVLETPMGFVFLREVFNKATGIRSESMTHIQCNRSQFKWFVETRLTGNKEQVGALLRKYRSRR